MTLSNKTEGKRGRVRPSLSERAAAEKGEESEQKAVEQGRRRQQGAPGGRKKDLKKKGRERS